ncbi:ABC transporter ATP-binding protein [Caldicellulosiruptor changbaiensis]|uniref:ABC transporter ATP-binding protein n=1 Tax=Caldicellulosiruptor changbaiensis TaxID=1222016 RepID=A0A3T0D7N4_9FIRM|nr:ABC transporter ATP-binding protein [Caldicellulosiruptor changbaiensis]AZT91140.1 ABC transporter ATP-binding protein [Caldicellulosiruptor changbaiensis]
MEKRMLYKSFNLTKSFGKKVVFERLSFEIFEGECVLIEGPNGSGKTTLLNILSKFDIDYQGEVLFRGVDLKKENLKDLPISFLPDEPIYYEALTVKEHMKLVAITYGYSKKEAQSLIDSISVVLDLKDYHNFFPSWLSKGTKQKFMIALSLLKRFDVYIADEPFANLDSKTILTFCEILETLKECGKTIILTSHQKNEHLEKLVDRNIILAKGRNLKR